MAKALEDLKQEDQKRVAELQEEKDEVTRLKAEIERMVREHASEIKDVTNSCSSAITDAKKEFQEKAKKETAEIEKKLGAEIEKLKEENQLQKVAADDVAKKMLEWTNLASELNHKMEGTNSGLTCSRFLRVTLFPGYSVFAGLLLFWFHFVPFCLLFMPVSIFPSFSGLPPD